MFSPIKIRNNTRPRAEFIEHQSYPNGSCCEHGLFITKVWLVKNPGNTRWPAGTKLILESQTDNDLLHELDKASLTEGVVVPLARPGETVEIAAQFRLPRQDTYFFAAVRLCDSSRAGGSSSWNCFGPRLETELDICNAMTTSKLPVAVSNNNEISQQQAEDDDVHDLQDEVKCLNELTSVPDFKAFTEDLSPTPSVKHTRGNYNTRKTRKSRRKREGPPELCLPSVSQESHAQHDKQTPEDISFQKPSLVIIISCSNNHNICIYLYPSVYMKNTSLQSRHSNNVYIYPIYPLALCLSLVHIYIGVFSYIYIYHVIASAKQVRSLSIELSPASSSLRSHTNNPSSALSLPTNNEHKIKNNPLHYSLNDSVSSQITFPVQTPTLPETPIPIPNSQQIQKNDTKISNSSLPPSEGSDIVSNEASQANAEVALASAEDKSDKSHTGHTEQGVKTKKAKKNKKNKKKHIQKEEEKETKEEQGEAPANGHVHGQEQNSVVSDDDSDDFADYATERKQV